ncbi:MAG: NAD(P)H-hydrate epimerase [Anaerolineales bacterium]|nr:NAD(P)H-hydrate epimerase [Anaerolineales bacterium]
MTIPIYDSDLPFLTTEQMVEVDRTMMFDYKIELIQMMENAGGNLARLARGRFLGGDPRGKRVIILAGTGGNGGGALVCARRLHTYGTAVTVYLTKPAADFMPVPAHQLDILRRMRVPVAQADALAHAAAPDLIIDGIIGYSLQGAPRGAAGDMIRRANRQDAPILALDVPSGVDTTSGKVYDPAVEAVATMTLALPKAGLRAAGVQKVVGELYLADIGVPPELYAAPALGLTVPHIFAEHDLVRLW